jgi:hypothetical protein
MDRNAANHDKPKKDQHKHSNPVERQVEPSEGTSWQFYVVLAIVAIGILALITKTIGLF